MGRNEYNNGTEGQAQPNPEVEARANRRRFSAEYKRQIVAEAGRCDEPGDIGALLRREGLYSSQLSEWRQQAEAGKLANSPSVMKSRFLPAVDLAPTWDSQKILKKRYDYWLKAASL
ncbi:MAG: transposase [Caldilineaceae bacterium]|nr:transposase [Caldilineaceae bacterium]